MNRSSHPRSLPEATAKSEELIYDGDTALRVDRLLKARYPDISRAYLQRIIDEKRVRINNRNARKSDLVSYGDRIEIDPFVSPNQRRIEPNSSVPFQVVWESEEMVVIDKPAGVATHPNDFDDHNTLANGLLARYPEIADVGDDRLRPGIVHRLDTDTSGLLLAARTEASFRALRKQFDERKVKKTYIALVLGQTPERGFIDVPVAHHPTNPRKMVPVVPGRVIRSRVREARTEYERMEAFKDYTLVAVRTLTGRMHQVRVHFASIGHPLAGDRLYQNAKQRSADTFLLRRHFLHAHKIELEILPSNSLELFVSNLHDDLDGFLKKLRGV